MSRKRRIDEKPKWLKEREAQNRASLHGRQGSGNGAGLEQTVAQASASSAKAESITATVTPVSTGYNAQQQKPEDVLHGATKGWNGGSGGGAVIAHSSFPKWTYIPLTLAAAVLIYAAGAVTNVFPTPPEVVRYLRPAPAVTTPSASTPKQDEQPQLNGNKQQADILSIVNSELSRLRRYPEIPQIVTLADAIEATLGQDGYSATEASMINTIGPAAEMLALRNIPERIEDLKIILQTKSYRSSTVNVGDRELELVVLASDPARAPFYFDALQHIIPKIEAFSGLKYEERTFDALQHIIPKIEAFNGLERTLVIYSQPEKGKGLENIAVAGGLITWYPEANKQVVRRYEVTTEQKALEENIAHEFDHILSGTRNLPVWLAEGKANFTSYHALRSGNGLPTLEAPFTGYRANIELNVKNIFGGEIPPISKYDGTYPELAKQGVTPPAVTGLGELMLQDILVMIGPQNMSDIVKELNAKSFVDKGVFYSTVLTHTPLDLQQNMNAFLKERYEGAK